MKAHVRVADASDIDAICQLLHTKMNPKIPLHRWRQLMEYQWLAEKPDYGRVVDSNGQVLGFCGMVYADRLVGRGENRRLERIVSMSSWYLDKSLRGQGLGKALLEASTEDANQTYATVTNSKKPIAIVEAHGFRELETHRYFWQKQSNRKSLTTIVLDPELISERLHEESVSLLIDMQPYPVTPILACIDNVNLLLFFSVKAKSSHKIWFDLLYASDYSLFSRYAQPLADQLLPDYDAYLAADGRFVEGRPLTGNRLPLPVSRYFISQRVEPNEIDLLYSELQLLDLKLD